jgi:hypothetical protein
MTQFFAIIIIAFVFASIVFLIKIKSTTLQILKSKELNNEENKLEKNYEFIKGLF